MFIYLSVCIDRNANMQRLPSQLMTFFSKQSRPRTGICANVHVVVLQRTMRSVEGGKLSFFKEQCRRCDPKSLSNPIPNQSFGWQVVFLQRTMFFAHRKCWFMRTQSYHHHTSWGKPFEWHSTTLNALWHFLGSWTASEPSYCCPANAQKSIKIISERHIVRYGMTMYNPKHF